MSTTIRNRLLTLGVLLALVTPRPYRLAGFLVAALAYAPAEGLVLGPVLGTLVNGAVSQEAGP